MFTVTLVGTGLMTAGPHTVRLTAELPAGSPEAAVDRLLGLLSDTGSFQVSDSDGHTLVVDRDVKERQL